jgi:hypothetical protein
MSTGFRKGLSLRRRSCSNERTRPERSAALDWWKKNWYYVSFVILTLVIIYGYFGSR